MRAYLAVPLIAISAAAYATPPLPPPEARVAEHARQVDAARMKASIARMVAFGTRHKSRQTCANDRVELRFRSCDRL